MIKTISRTTLGILAALAAVSPAAAANLAADDIRALVAGRTVFLSTPLGMELPLLYRKDGSVSGDVSGFSAASMFAPEETGRWWVTGNRLCQKWPTWYDGKQFCFTIERMGEAKIRWVRDDGFSGTARIAGAD